MLSERRERQTWGWASRESIDERLERAVRFLEVGGIIHTAFNQESDLTFFHDGDRIRAYRDRAHNPGWFSNGKTAVSDLRHQLRLDLDYDWGLAEEFRSGNADGDREDNDG